MSRNGPMQWTLVRSPALGVQMNGRPVSSSGSEEDFHLSLHSSQDSDSESLVQEMKYQSDLQQWISRTQGHVHPEDAYKGGVNDSLDGCERTQEVRKAPTKVLAITKAGVQKDSSLPPRRHDLDDYAALRYDPNWKKRPTDHARVKEDFQEDSFQDSDEEMPNMISEESSNPPQIPAFRMFPGKDNEENEIRGQTYFDSELCGSATSHNAKQRLSERPNLASTGHFSLHDNRIKEMKLLINAQRQNISDIATSTGFFLTPFGEDLDEPSVGGDGFHQNGIADGKDQETKRNFQKQAMQQFVQKKDFIEKNKLTLGKPTQKTESYLQLLSKKKGDVDTGQIPDHSKAPEEAPTWIVIEDQPANLDPEDRWQMKARKLKERKKNNNVESGQRKPGRHKEFTTVRRQRPLGGNIILDPGKPAGLPPGGVNAPYFAINSDVFEAPLEPSNTNNSTGINRMKVLPQISKPEVNNQKQMNRISPETLSQINPSIKYELFPGNLQYQNFHEYNAGDESTIKDRKPPPQNLTVGFGATSNLQSSEHSRQTSSSSLNQFMDSFPTSFPQNMGYPTELGHFQSTRHALPNPVLPPILPRVESDLLLNAEWSDRHQATITRSNSEGYLLQAEKLTQAQEKKNTVSRLRGFINRDIKLGGLGPDYQGMKDKAEQLKQQKEYAKKVTEQNRKNASNPSKAQVKPAVQPESKPPVSRHKAMEYAKKIPKPKPATSFRSPDQDPKDENVAMDMQGDSLPQMTLLEELQLRHEREKAAVAAFKALRIL